MRLKTILLNWKVVSDHGSGLSSSRKNFFFHIITLHSSAGCNWDYVKWYTAWFNLFPVVMEAHRILQSSGWPWQILDTHTVMMDPHVSPYSEDFDMNYVAQEW